MEEHPDAIAAQIFRKPIFTGILAAALTLYVADTTLAAGKYSASIAAMGRSMAMHFGLSMKRS